MCLLACSFLAAPAFCQVEQLGNGAYLFRSGAQRSLFIVDDDGVIVTDPINAEVAADYRAAIREITDAPVEYVIYSHYHWDRIAGAQIFKEEGATVVAQERCAQRFRDNPNPAVVVPDVTFTGRYEVSVGNSKLELHYFGPSHGDCLTVFVAKPSNLLQAVDLVNPPRASFPADPLGAYIRPHNLLRFFARLEGLVAAEGIDRVVASSASVDQLALGPATLVAAQARFWDEVYDATRIAGEQGNVDIDSYTDMETVDLAVFEPYDGYSVRKLKMLMRRINGWQDMGR
ncbi:MAG: MBL fold metallo-hydrolase [Gammaproteobacteria bacterium]|nr:MBL fold metallo-hydrolase [Gammaproteobacteria bacterium]NND36506.1 MBL fold metallo-hydrolase [Gammaproteobacteria bacterium]